MYKHLIVLSIAVLLLSVGLSGCNDADKESKRFIGTWKYSDGNYWVNYTFLSNGTFFCIERGGMKTHQGNWEVRNGKFVLNDDSLGESIKDYSFSDDGNTLTLIVVDEDELNDGITSILIKQ